MQRPSVAETNHTIQMRSLSPQVLLNGVLLRNCRCNKYRTSDAACLDYVLIPTPSDTLKVSNNGRALLSSRFISTASPSQAQVSRPKRSAARRSYSIQPLFDEESDDERARNSEVRTRRRQAQAQISDTSDFEDTADSGSSSDEVSEVDSSDGHSIGSSGELSEEEVATTKKRRSATQVIGGPPQTTKKTSSNKTMKKLISYRDKGLDLTLPPLSDIKDIFTDLTGNALTLDFGDAVQKLGSRPLRVATMCSGTESPLVAIQMVGEALKECSDLNLQIEHLFSVEIVPFKQAYIERNFHPSIIFSGY